MPNSSMSALRLQATMNNDPALATMRNHWLSGTSAATAPAMGRSRNPTATPSSSTIAICLSFTE